jgi:2-polyprenyl-6-methoxyphenol hydroxylase-like FAD-dependent oxidoreductase
MAGGSVGGLFAANLLRSIGWDVVVFERSAGDLASRGTGIGASEALFAVMRRVGVRLDPSIGIPVRSRLCLDRGGNVIAEVPTGDITTAWARIYRSLKHALPAEHCHFNLAVKRVDQDAHGVTAEVTDGSRVTGDLLIAADGLDSTVRRQVLPEIAPPGRPRCPTDRARRPPGGRRSRSRGSARSSSARRPTRR